MSVLDKTIKSVGISLISAVFLCWGLQIYMSVHLNSNTDYKISDQWRVRIDTNYRELIRELIAGAPFYPSRLVDRTLLTGLSSKDIER